MNLIQEQIQIFHLIDVITVLDKQIFLHLNHVNDHHLHYHFDYNSHFMFLLNHHYCIVLHSHIPNFHIPDFHSFVDWKHHCKQVDYCYLYFDYWNNQDYSDEENNDVKMINNGRY